MNDIGTFTPEQARTLWQDYQRRQQLTPQIQANYPQRRPIDEVSPHRVFVKNASGEVIPAYGCLKITGTENVGGRTALTVDKPSTTSGDFIFNSQFAIAVGGVGWAYRFGVVVMLGDEPTTSGDTYQPIVDSWEIEEGDGPFVVFGRHIANDRALLGRFVGRGGGTSTVNVVHGIVRQHLGCGYYEVYIAEWNGTTPVTTASDSVTEDNCDPCNETGSGSGGGCGGTAILDQPQLQVEPTSVIVLAFDSASLWIPLVQGSQCLMIDAGDENSALSMSVSVSSGENEPVYQIIRGLQETIVEYIERWECCEGTDTLVGRTPVIFIGKRCGEETCTEC